MKSLRNRLKNELVQWRPSAADERIADEWLIGMMSPIYESSVVVMSDDRWRGDDFANIEKSYSLMNGDVVSVRKVAEYARLKGLSSVLSMIDDAGGYSPDTGRAVEYEYTLAPRNQPEVDTVKINVIFVVAESVEFFMKFLLPNKIEVETIVARKYHIGFNACRSTGWWLPRAAEALGCEFLLSDMPEDIIAGTPNCRSDETLFVFPEMNEFPMPRLGQSYDSELGDGMMLWDLCEGDVV